MGSIRQSLQAQPKNIKKLSKHQINQYPKKIIRTPNLPIRTNISPKKTYLKKEKEPKIRELPDGICRLNPKC
jgi:hypothetical protein